jgi:hypothetical protein
VAAALLACGGAAQQTGLGGDDGGPQTPDAAADDVAPAPQCPPCVTDHDCSGSVCAQLGGDTYCAPACAHGDECTPDRQCTSVSSSSGAQVSVCVPRGAVCSAPAPVGPADAGADAPDQCGGLVGPGVSAGCTCASGKSCAANGCYGGWWCNTATNHCQMPPAGCGSAPGGPYAGGPPVTGMVGPTGGAVSRLYFAVVGDTRPGSIDDTAGYPTPVITKIYSDLDALAPRPTFAVSTGDYQFSSPSGGEAATQLDLYLGARAKYPGTLFPTMGNHECTGLTNSNCGSGNADGVTNNYTSYLAKLLAPIQQASPSYEIDVNGADGSWTAKLLFVAANAWDQSQANWLDQAMSRATTYTFIVRHEAASVNTAPGVSPSENVMSKHPYTLAICGHTHTYEHPSQREIIVGNGGAPLTGGKNYGFGMVSQRADGALDVDMIDYASGEVDSSFHFAVKADGSPAP